MFDISTYLSSTGIPGAEYSIKEYVSSLNIIIWTAELTWNFKRKEDQGSVNVGFSSE